MSNRPSESDSAAPPVDGEKLARFYAASSPRVSFRSVTHPSTARRSRNRTTRGLRGSALSNTTTAAPRRTAPPSQPTSIISNFPGPDHAIARCKASEKARSFIGLPGLARPCSAGGPQSASVAVNQAELSPLPVRKWASELVCWFAYRLPACLPVCRLACAVSRGE